MAVRIGIRKFGIGLGISLWFAAPFRPVVTSSVDFGERYQKPLSRFEGLTKPAIYLYP